MRTIVVIPARWESTRLPGKPLALIGDKPMIQHTWERASQSIADEVIVATDSQLVFDTVIGFGGQAILTGDCSTGTERVIEVQKLKHADFVINVQGDEPFIEPKDIDNVIKTLNAFPEFIITLKTNLIDNESTDPNAVKVITDNSGNVVMFTRSSVYVETNFVFKHIGIYGYSASNLDIISNAKPTESSISNSLEQLTWMDNGILMLAGFTEYKSFGIDTPSDLERANKMYK